MNYWGIGFCIVMGLYCVIGTAVVAWLERKEPKPQNLPAGELDSSTYQPPLHHCFIDLTRSAVHVNQDGEMWGACAMQGCTTRMRLHHLPAQTEFTARWNREPMGK